MLNHCPVCGGVKSINRPETNMRVSLGPFKSCTCKPAPEPRTFVYPIGGIEYCRNCGKSSVSLPFALPGLCKECHALPSITTKYSTRTGEPLPTNPDGLTEVMQLHGHPLYVRLDWRDPELAAFELGQIRATLKDVFACIEGYGGWDAKIKEVREG